MPRSREVFRNIGRGLIEGQPINPRRDERPHFWIAVNLRSTSWSMNAAVFTDRRCGFWQGIPSLLKAGFNGGFRGRDRASLCGVAGTQFSQCLDKMIAGAGCHGLASF